MRRVFLLSDGDANVGITHSVRICDLVEKYFLKGISTTCFGIGLEYNIRLMKGIKDKGKGNLSVILVENYTQS